MTDTISINIHLPFEDHARLVQRQLERRRREGKKPTLEQLVIEAVQESFKS